MFPLQSFVKNGKSEGGHMDQNQDPIGQMFHYNLMKEKGRELGLEND